MALPVIPDPRIECDSGNQITVAAIIAAINANSQALTDTINNLPTSITWAVDDNQTTGISTLYMAATDGEDITLIP